MLRELFHGREPEYIGELHVRIDFLGDLVEQLYRLERISAGSEEIVAGCDIRTVQVVSVYLHQRRFDAVQRSVRCRLFCHQRLGVDLRSQLFPVDLAVRCHRHLAHPRVNCRQHVFRQLLFQLFSERFLVKALACRVEQRDHAGLLGIHRDSRAHLIDAQTACLYLAEFDTLAVYLDLIVVPAEDIYLTVRKVFAEIARIVHQISRVRVRYEHLLRLFLFLQVSTTDIDALRVHQSLHVARAKLQIVVHHKVFHVIHASALRDPVSLLVFLLIFVVYRPDRRLGRSAYIVYLYLRIQFPESRWYALFQLFAAHQYHSERCYVGIAGIVRRRQHHFSDSRH